MKLKSRSGVCRISNEISIEVSKRATTRAPRSTRISIRLLISKYKDAIREFPNGTHQSTSLPRLANIRNITTKREQALARANPNCGYAMEWIRRNANKFKQEIIFPAAVSVNVSDPSFAHLVELACGNNLQVSHLPRLIERSLAAIDSSCSRFLSRHSLPRMRMTIGC